MPSIANVLQRNFLYNENEIKGCVSLSSNPLRMRSILLDSSMQLPPLPSDMAHVPLRARRAAQRTMLPPLPGDTAYTTRAVFNLTNAYLIIGDQAEQWLRDVELVDPSPVSEQSATSRIRLAFMTIFQFAAGLPDRLAADAVRTRLDWKYALHLPLNAHGFDYTVLREYRQSVSRSPVDWRLLQRLIEQVAAIGLLPLTQWQCVDVNEVLIVVETLSRIEDLFETLCAALDVIATRWPDWLHSLALPHWREHYTQRSLLRRLPGARTRQEELAKAIGKDAAHLLTALDGAQLDGASSPVEIRQLRQIWQQQFVADQGDLHWRLFEYRAALS